MLGVFGRKTARCAIVCGALSLPAWATPVDTLGLGARAKGMGRAAAADTPDFSSNYYSPAKLAFAERPQLSFGATSTTFSLRYAGRASGVEPARAWVFGLLAPGSVAGLPVALGIAGHVPRGHISSSWTIREADPYWVLYEARVQLLYTSLNLAVRVLPYWSVAVGTATLATTQGALNVRGTAVLPEFERSEYESELEHQVDAKLMSVRYPQYSTALSLSEHFKAQVSYREEASLDASMSAELDAEIDGTLVQIPVHYDVLVDSVRLFIPRQLSASAAWSSGALTLVGDLTFHDWSGYKSPVSTTRTHVQAEPPPGVSVDLPEAPEPSTMEPPRFRDQWAPRLGLEYRLPLGPNVALPLRGGYGYAASPVPRQSGRTSFLDADQHLLSAGMGSVMRGLAPLVPGALRVDLALQWGVLRKRPATGAAAKHATLTHDGSFLAFSGDISVEF